MATCKDIESKLAAYVDRDQPAADRVAVETHLRACPECRTRAQAEQAIHELVCSRRMALRGCAPAGLRRRCAGRRRSSFVGSLPRRPWVSLSLAASLVLITAVFLVFGWGSSVETYAAQLAADHLKCFQFPPDASSATDVTLVGKTWLETSGWALKVAASSPSEQLQLLGIRRCGSSRGRVAHVFYKWRGEPLSVYVLNHRFDRAPDAAHDHDFNKLGEHEIVWTARERTYAVVASRRVTDLNHAAMYVRRSVE
jgi:anti-sigma factor RsiW